MSKPQAVVIAGPNGSGKSTCAELLLPPDMTFINADMIAQELTGVRSTTADLQAGRILIERVEALELARKDFAIETTLATKRLYPRLEKFKAAGYETHLIFLWMPSDDLAVERVAARVRAGGHHVPEATIRRRFRSGLQLFFSHYQEAVDTWKLYDNSKIADPQLIAWGKKGVEPVCNLPELYDDIREKWAKKVEPVDFTDVEAVHERVTEAVRNAFRRHKEMKNPLPTWDGSAVRIVGPDDLPESRPAGE